VKIELASYLLVLSSFVLGLYLYLIPFPAPITFFKPQWCVLILIYWGIAIPHKMGIFIPVLLGFFLDIVEGVVLGSHSFALLFVYLICTLGYQRLRVFSTLQQCILIFAIVGFYLLIFYWLNSLSMQSVVDFRLIFSAISSAIIWPIIFFSLRIFRRRFKIA